MFQILTRRLRRLALAAMLATVCPASTPASAGDFDCGSDIYTADSIQAADSITAADSIQAADSISGAKRCTQSATAAADEELCGWIPMATHDSCPMPRRAGPSRIETARVSDVESHQGGGDGAIIGNGLTAALIATTAVHFQQFAEPFAMVRPTGDDVVISISDFQTWCDAAMAQAETLQASDQVAADAELEIQQQLERLALLEPVDVHPHGDSVVVARSEREPVIEITPLDPLVGSSPFVVTLEEAYLPYDLSASDLKSRNLKLWSVLPSNPEPFCVRSRRESSVAMWTDFDDQVAEKDWAAELKSSPECLLEQAVAAAENWLSADRLAWAAPDRIGQSMAFLATTLAPGSAQTRQPQPAVRVELAETLVAPASETGMKLLARAGIESVSQPMCQIASLNDPAFDVAIDSESASTR